MTADVGTARLSIAAAAGAACLCAGLVSLHLTSALTAIAGGTLCLLLPGFLIVRAIAPSTDLDELPLLVLLAIAVSIAATIAVGAVLAATSKRIQSEDAALGLAAVAVLSGTVAALRASPRARTRSLPTRVGLGRPRLSASGLVLALAAAGCVAISLVALGETQSQAPYTELGAVRLSGRVELTIINHQGASQKYTYLVTQAGDQVARGSFGLRAGQTFAVLVKTPPRKWLSVSLFSTSLRRADRTLDVLSR